MMKKREFTIKLEETTYDNGNHLVIAKLYNEKDKELRTSAVSKMNNETYSFKQITKNAFDLLMSDFDDIKEGDYVKVIDSGKCYTTYTDWIGKNITSELAAHYVYGHKPDSFEKYKVIKRVDNILYIGYPCAPYGVGPLENVSVCYLISIDGVEKVCETDEEDED